MLDVVFTLMSRDLVNKSNLSSQSQDQVPQSLSLDQVSSGLKLSTFRSVGFDILNTVNCHIKYYIQIIAESQIIVGG